MTIRPHHTVDGPDGAQTVVLAGGLGTDVSMWEPQVEPLVEAGFRVLRYDHRGHGRSPVPDGPYEIADLAGDAVALLDGHEHVHWVGLSLGGMVGMWLAQHRPELIDRLVLCCTSARLGPPRMWAERAELVRAEGIAVLAEAAVGRWLTPAGRAADPARAAGLTAMFTATPAAGYAGCCEALRRMDLTPALGRITAPTLVIAGAQDLATPPEHARRIVYSVPGARLAVVDGAAHLATVERPDVVTRQIV